MHKHMCIINLGCTRLYVFLYVHQYCEDADPIRTELGPEYTHLRVQ